jgi:PAS domain S-box-containing protein
MEKSYWNICWLGYTKLVHSNSGVLKHNYKRGDIAYWRDVLFLSILEYCLPISLLTIIPGLCLLHNDTTYLASYVAIVVFVLLSIATFARVLALRWRKFIVVAVFYALATYHTYTLGYVGFGMFYLLAITVVIALILSVKYAYFSIVVDAIILAAFGLIVWLEPQSWPLAHHYRIRDWIIFSLSLVLVELIVILLIDKTFNLLQITIYKKDKMRDNYTRIFDSSPIPMWVFDIDTLQFLAVNDAAIKQYGYTRQKFLQLSIPVLWPTAQQQELTELVSLHKEQIQFSLDDVVHLTKSNEVIHVKIESRLLTYKGKKAKLVLATNITAAVKAKTDKDKADLKIKQSEANLKAIFGSTVEGYLLLDDTYHIISFNEKARTSMLLNKNQLMFRVGKSIFDYIEDSRIATFKQLLAKVETGTTVEYGREYTVNDKKLWVHYTVTPVYQDHVMKGICINGRDITEYHNHMQTIEAQNRILKDISWMQSHVVRAPLARIMAIKPLLEDCDDRAECNELLNYLELSCDELDAVIRRIVKDSDQKG